MIRRPGEQRAAQQKRASVSSAQYDFEEGQKVGIQSKDKGPAKAGSLGKYNRGNTPGNTPNPKKTEAYRSSGEAGDDDFYGDLGRSPSPYGGKYKAYNNDYNTNFGVTGSTMASTSPLTPSRSPRTSPRTASVHDLLPSEEPSLMRNGRTPRRKIAEPKPRDEGRWVKHAENLDSRGGTQMKGALIRDAPSVGTLVKESEDPHAHLEKLKGKDAADQTVKFCGFTDRTIRLQDGNAMKAVFTPPVAWNCKTSDCKPGCNCPVCRPMRSSLLPPAGQVVQVDVGNAGTPPYVLQTQVTGMMAVMPEQRLCADGSEINRSKIGRKSSLATSFGRHFFKKQRLPDYKDFDRPSNEHMVGRGCEPEEKGRDRMQDSSGVEQALTGNLEAGDGAEAADEIMHRATGQKGRLEAPGVALNTMKGMLVYEDGDMAKQPHLSKKRVEAAWTKTKIFLGHIEPELQQPPPRRVKKPSNFSTVPAFTSDELRKARTFTLRFEGCPTACLQGGSCMGVGDEDKDKEMRDFRHTKRSPFAFEDHLRGGNVPAAPTTALSRSASCPPAAMRSDSDFAADVDSENALFQVPTPARRIAGAGFAGVPSGYLRETGRGKQFADTGEETKMAKCMAHIAPQDDMVARSDRMIKEPKFAERIYETQFAEEQQKRVFASILKSIHHLGSGSVQDALRWS